MNTTPITPDTARTTFVPRLARTALGATALAAALTLPACVVAIGNESDGTSIDSAPRRVRLTDTERRDLPVVTTVADLPTVRTKYAPQIATLSPSTTVDDLRRVLPDADWSRAQAVGTHPRIVETARQLGLGRVSRVGVSPEAVVAQLTRSIQSPRP